MSRGLGEVQRWLLASLPDAEGSGRRRVDDGMMQPQTLAADFYRTANPTQGQVSSIRRALRGLEDRDLVSRWGTQINRPGCPSFWTLAR